MSHSCTVVCFADCKTTISTTQPRTSSVKRGSTTPPTSISKAGCGLKLGIRRGKQRWSALVSAPTSRFAAYMRDRLGDALWSDFVRHANWHYKARFVRAFCKPTLRCVGRLDGAPCPHAFRVDLASPDGG